MSDIFICYSRKDIDTAMRLLQLFEAEGWRVFIDKQTHVGRRWHKEIEKELHATRAVVVLWSATSRDSDYVLEEAEYGKRKNILFPAFIEAVEFPYGFSRIQTVDLSNLNDNPVHPNWLALLRSLRLHLNGYEQIPIAPEPIEPPRPAVTPKPDEGIAGGGTTYSEGSIIRKFLLPAALFFLGIIIFLQFKSREELTLAIDSSVIASQKNLSNYSSSEMPLIKNQAEEPQIQHLRSKEEDMVPKPRSKVVLDEQQTSTSNQKYERTPVADSNQKRAPMADSKEKGAIVDQPSLAPTIHTNTWKIDGDIVIDEMNGLVWTRGDFKTITGRFVKNWDEAMSWAKEMNMKSYGGYSDWQVASIAEYRTIRKSSWRNTFLTDQEDYYWSRNEISKYVASYIDFYKGFATSGPKENQRWTAGSKEGKLMNFSVRLVRNIQ